MLVKIFSSSQSLSTAESILHNSWWLPQQLFILLNSICVNRKQFLIEWPSTSATSLLLSSPFSPRLQVKKLQGEDGYDIDGITMESISWMPLDYSSSFPVPTPSLSVHFVLVRQFQDLHLLLILEVNNLIHPVGLFHFPLFLQKTCLEKLFFLNDNVVSHMQRDFTQITYKLSVYSPKRSQLVNG